MLLSVMLTILLALTPAPPLPCTPPPILHKGIAPQTMLTYQFYGAWTPTEEACVEQGLSIWSHATADTVRLQFHPVASVQDHPTVSLTKTRLPFPIGGAVVGVRRDANGYVIGGGVVYSDDPSRLSSCDGLRKTTLHEIGHLMGLGHVEDTPVGVWSSIMQPSMRGANDREAQLPSTVTGCDIEQARRAMDGEVSGHRE